MRKVESPAAICVVAKRRVLHAFLQVRGSSGWFTRTCKRKPVVAKQSFPLTESPPRNDGQMQSTSRPEHQSSNPSTASWYFLLFWRETDLVANCLPKLLAESRWLRPKAERPWLNKPCGSTRASLAKLCSAAAGKADRSHTPRPVGKNVVSANKLVQPCSVPERRAVSPQSLAPRHV